MAETVAQLQKELNDLSSSCDKKLDLITTGLRKDILSSQQSLEKCYEQKTTLNNNFTLAQKQLKEMEVFKSSLTQCQQKATLAKQTNQDTQSKMEKQLTDLQNENQQMKQKHRKEFSLHQSHLEKCYSDNQKTKKEIELANQQLTLNSQLLNFNIYYSENVFSVVSVNQPMDGYPTGCTGCCSKLYGEKPHEKIFKLY
ncbi:uncharacterized protein LOC128883103 [Hylaeus volcanicus]|uniref:uncharacterized protein LOC128883103 n=1 Tax=Hylaeus volcanicus TaxID=313075 RepID=UPI0023B851D4|nr:uncharacterized protein LOC128883103 [Hylaeus volcanicus]